MKKNNEFVHYNEKDNKKMMTTITKK